MHLATDTPIKFIGKVMKKELLPSPVDKNLLQRYCDAVTAVHRHTQPSH